MKKNIEAWTDYDYAGMWTLNIRKKRGKLTLDEITDTCREWEEDFYLLVIKAFGDETDQYYATDDLDGDYVRLYRAGSFFAWREKTPEVGV